MTTQLTRMTSADIKARQKHAHAYLKAADLIVGLGTDAQIEPTSNLIGSLAVLCGIAAADAICGHVRGERANGDNHSEAIVLLRRSSLPEERFAAQLKRLLDAKSTTQYSSHIIGELRANELLTAARRLVEGMDKKLRE